MTRSNVSRADRRLMDAATATGHPVSATQLERWRQHGLIPRSRPVYQGRHGTDRLYPAETGQLVCALASHAQVARTLEDLALLAYFNGAAVPEVALKTALALAYFSSRYKGEDATSAITSRLDLLDRVSPEYDRAEAEAVLELRKGGRAIRQMRINLKRRPDLRCCTRAQIDQRLLGVLTGLNRLVLPEKDLEFMEDLAAALALDYLTEDAPEPPAGDDVLAVWEWGAIAHVSQFAQYAETSSQERLELLFATSCEDLAALRDEVRQDADLRWQRASSGRRRTAPFEQPWMARGAGCMLVEWMSARQVHRQGAVLSELYHAESLARLHFACLKADVERAQQRGASADEVSRLLARMFGVPADHAS